MKKVIHIIPYADFYPPKNGGALRCYHLCLQLDKYYDITLLTLQPEESLLKQGFPSKNIKILNPLQTVLLGGLKNKLLNALKYRWYRRSLKGPADINFLTFYPVIVKLLKKETFDVVVFEHLQCVLLSPLFKRYAPKTIQIVDQHNVDHLLFEQENILHKNTKTFKRFNAIKEAESGLYRSVNLILACSDKDKYEFEVINNHKVKVHVIPNGVDVSNKPFDEGKDFRNSTLIFCGDLSVPANKNGLLWFYDEMWPKIRSKNKNVRLIVIGRNGHDAAYDLLKKDNSIDFVGEVPNTTPYYHKSNIAIVPLRIGSGTRLKILEAMCYGNPVVSTSKGAEGIANNNEQDIIIADTADAFVEKIFFLLNNPEKSKHLSLNAHKLVEIKYSWDEIGCELKNVLETTLN